jgi:glycosyltransferase involved in cell wall biosynthesis
MDISVIIPTRNRSALLAVTLRSVLRQRYVDIEVIVVDEASSDDTPALLAALADPRIRVIRHDSCQGVSAARNHGIAEARAEWVAFLDDDDLWAPDKLALQLRAAGESQSEWVYVGHVHINMSHRVTGGAPPLDPGAVLQQLPKSDVIPGGCSGVIVSKRALAVVGTFDTRFQSLADWDLWLRLAHAGMPAWVCRPLVGYRLHGHQMSLDASRILDEFRLFAEHHGEANRALLYRYLGWWALRVGNHQRALKFFVLGGLQWRPEYPTRVLTTDLRMYTQQILNRVGMGRVQVSRPPPLSEQEQSWRDAGQDWVDDLIVAERIGRE